ncbi:MAG TPA: hypothetical protein ENI95_10890 [Chloroflexi bacterium]|nr:hypothetical protein [Chloroflexota bacterium]
MQRSHSGLQALLDTPFVRRVRRNHGLEHATIHLLAQRIPNLRIVGRSDSSGFWLFGNVPTEAVRESATRALERMRKGEHHLALHPNCGTNLVTMALLGTVATFVALLGSDRERFGKLQRLPLVALGLMMTAVVAQPLGMRLQEHITTLGDPADLEIVDIQRLDRGGMTIHRVLTRST